VASEPPERLSRTDSDEIARRRRGRNWAILLALAGLCALFYAIAIVKMARP
jgi:fatty acid desaturase